MRMYTPDDLDRVIPLSTLPSSDVGAPLPALIAEEGVLELAYLAHEAEPSGTGRRIQIVGPSSGGRLVATVHFAAPKCHFFGPPNDEAFSGHPLYARGLRPYRAFEIEDSSWIRALERMNSVHRLHRPEHFAAYRHFVLAFHDSTFECVARGFDVETQRGSIHAALSRIVKRLSEEAT
jgi:hypothetical protein